jgi:hypothetical protein
MRKIWSLAPVVGLGVLVAVATAAAQSQPAAKATAAVTELVALQTVKTTDLEGAVSGLWTTVLSQQIKMANAKDLFITPTIECGNYTDTTVRSKDAVLDSSTAVSAVRVRVVIDPATLNAGVGPGPGGSYALPDNGLAFEGSPGSGVDGAGVTYCSRLQTLAATLQGILSCPAGAAIPTGCTTTPEEVTVLLNSLTANAFNFIAPDLTTGVHVVEVQALGVVDAKAVSGTAKARAFAGAGSVTIEAVRMIKGEQVEF